MTVKYNGKHTWTYMAQSIAQNNNQLNNKVTLNPGKKTKSLAMVSIMVILNHILQRARNSIL